MVCENKNFINILIMEGRVKLISHLLRQNNFVTNIIEDMVFGKRRTIEPLSGGYKTSYANW